MMTIVITMCKLLAALALGYGLNKADIFDSATSKKISSLILDVTSPALIVAAVANVQGVKDSKSVLMLLLFGFAFYAVLPVLAYIIVRLLGVEKDLRGTYMCMVIFANTAFMAYPVVEAVFGMSAIFYTSIFHMPFNLLFYSFGLYLFGKDAALTKRNEETLHGGKEELQSKQKSKFSIRKILNNGVVSAILALVIYFANISLPDLVVEPLQFIGGLTSPLSMMVIGSSIAGYSFKEIWGQKKIYLFMIIRLLILPTATWFLMGALTHDTMITGIATVTVGMPIASLVAMGSAQYDKQGKIGAIGVVCSTICSLISIPIMCALIGVG
ncbi:AEC family transporter [Lachnospiraceae bacterium ZAX-1]